MAKSKTGMAVLDNPVPKDKKQPDTCRLSFQKADGLQKVLPDLELEEDVTFTVTGKVRSLDMSQNNGPYDSYEHSSLEVEITSITNGATSKSQTNKNALEDMTKE